MAHIDISVVLNVHREGDLIYPTLRSLEEAAQNAQLHNIVCELIVVADNSDETTLRIVNENNSFFFSVVKLEKTNVRSLGLARNEGIRLACGEYIVTADADDLVSENYLTELHRIIKSSNRKSVVFPEYYQAFGDRSYVCRFYPSKSVGLSRLFGEHVYVSRLIAQRETLLETPYQDCSSHTVYAYEDYDLNLRLASRGFEFLIAPNTIIFYRQHSKSIMAQLGNHENFTPPNSNFFDAETYIQLLQNEFGNPIRETQHIEYKKDYINSCLINNYISQANFIEPEINPSRLWESNFFTNIGIPQKPGISYLEICKNLLGKSYSDVFFLPFLSKGGGEKYVLNFIRAAMLDRSRSCLIILGQELDPDKERIQIPPNVDVIDLFPLLGQEHARFIKDISFRIIKNFAPKSRLFLKYSEFCSEFMRKFSSALEEHKITYFYFCASYYLKNGYMFEDGCEHRLLLDNTKVFDLIISDHASNLQELERRIPAWKKRTYPLYNYTTSIAVKKEKGRKRRLIWASRLDIQKRPDLLCSISQEIEALNMEIEIHVYGDSVLNHFDVSCFDFYKNIHYKGSFNGLKSIEYTDQDGFLYTSLYDGMPNVILEAIELKLPIISVDVGGINELLDDDCAFIIKNTPDDNQIILSYTSKIIEFIHATDENISQKTNLLYKKLHDQHAFSAYRKKVDQIYRMLECEKIAGEY